MNTTPPTLEIKDAISLIMGFVLYVLCFASLYRPYLELIGYGMFFALNTIMSVGMIKSSNYTNKMNVKTDITNQIKALCRLFIPNQGFFVFYFLYNIGVFIFTLLMSIFLFGLFIITLPFQIPIKLFGWSGDIPVYWTIFIGLLFLFVAFIMLLITLMKLHAKHNTLNSPTMPKFLKGGSGEVKSGYTFDINGRNGQGRGYYLNEGVGVNFYFNNKRTDKKASDFKIIAITTTVLIWIQYLANKYMGSNANGVIIGNVTILSQNMLNNLLLLNGITIVSLSSVCIWLTQSIGSFMGKIQSPPKPKNNGSSTQLSPTQPSPTPPPLLDAIPQPAPISKPNAPQSTSDPYKITIPSW